ncbi:DUF7402 domain-containing protein [Kineococcus gypseus]|uniref:DUF7402 domain-containing protein n=1 Tax=Kineococcus gypseus TaxID=1637102 RepID=UPI003D7C77E5
MRVFVQLSRGPLRELDAQGREHPDGSPQNAAGRSPLRRNALGVALGAFLVAVSSVLPASPAGATGTVADPAAPVVTTSSALSGSSPADLRDGSFATGVEGRQWTAGTTDQAPWVRLKWSSPRRVASLQVLGPAQAAPASATPEAAPLHGRLYFSDGTSVVVSGIAAGGSDPTTVAFAPRTVTSVRLELRRQVPGTVLGLREIAVHDAATTPPRWPKRSAGYSSTPVPASCGATSPAVSPRPATGLGLVCPAVGSSVGTSATVVVWAPPGTSVTARGWRLDQGTAGVGSLYPVATATAGADGRAVLKVDTTTLPKGPTALRVTRTDGTGPALHVQVVNTSGRAVPAPVTAPAGMVLRYADEFDAPLSVSQTGTGALYGAAKPEPWGSSQFGMGVFADPARGTGTMSTVPGGYLRLRAEAIGARDIRADWGQRHVSGLLSSARVGGSGFSAQRGYFEARVLGAPGPGAWPAFWMVNTEAATPRNTQSSGAEVDAVELYGHDTSWSCHTSHSWFGGSDVGVGTAGPCVQAVRPADWAASWHTYGARVTAGGAVFTVDGVEVARVSGLTRTDEPFFFMLNLALGGGWPVDLSRTGETTDMYVDWVRVYT